MKYGICHQYIDLNKTINVLEFGSPPREDPRCYPGSRASDSYVFLGATIAPLYGKNTSIGKLRAGNDLLMKIFPDLDDRYMIVGYGSNASPAQLKHKFTGENPKMPVLRGSLKDYDVVYAGRFTSYGCIPATITESKGTIVEAWANVLNAKQLDIMNWSEGRGSGYHLARINGSFKLDSGESFSPVYTYMSSGGPLLVDGQPVRLAEVNANGTKFQGKKQPEILDYFRQKIAPECDTLDKFILKIKTEWKNMKSEMETGDYEPEFDILDCGKTPPTISEMD